MNSIIIGQDNAHINSCFFICFPHLCGLHLRLVAYASKVTAPVYEEDINYPEHSSSAMTFRKTLDYSRENLCLQKILLAENIPASRKRAPPVTAMRVLMAGLLSPTLVHFMPTTLTMMPIKPSSTDTTIMARHVWMWTR